MKATESEDMKRLINARLWYCISQKTSVQAIAKLSGFTPQTFYNIQKNSRMPHTDTLLAIRRAIPGINLDALYSEDEELPMESLFDATVPTTIIVHQSADGIDWKARYEELEGRIESIVANMNQKYNDLLDKFGLLENQKNFMEKVLRKLDPSLFSESDSQFTVFPTKRNLIGYGRQDNAECIVRMHPATAANLRMLNSRASAVSVEG